MSFSLRLLIFISEHKKTTYIYEIVIPISISCLWKEYNKDIGGMSSMGILIGIIILLMTVIIFVLYCCIRVGAEADKKIKFHSQLREEKSDRISEREERK